MTVLEGVGRGTGPDNTDESPHLKPPQGIDQATIGTTPPTPPAK
jgi:hypothetical protein